MFHAAMMTLVCLIHVDEDLCCNTLTTIRVLLWSISHDNAQLFNVLSHSLTYPHLLQFQQVAFSLSFASESYLQVIAYCFAVAYTTEVLLNALLCPSLLALKQASPLYPQRCRYPVVSSDHL